MSSSQWIEEDDDGFIGLVGPLLRQPSTDNVGRFRFHAQAKHANRAGFVHGGMLMTAADRSMGRTARMEKVDRSQATAQFAMQFFEPVRIGEIVDIVCTPVRQTRHLVFMQGDLFVESRKVASAQGVWKIIGRA